MRLMATQEARRQDTRSRLVKAARERFMAQGFDAASTADILADAGLSKGALYHHFATKEDLFAAVYAEVSRSAIAQAAARAAPAATAKERLVAVGLAWLDVAATPAMARLLFEDGPAALGWARAKAIEDDNAARTLRRAIDAVTAENGPGPVAPTLAARLISAALGELALLRLTAQGDALTRAQIEDALARLVEALLLGDGRGEPAEG